MPIQPATIILLNNLTKKNQILDNTDKESVMRPKTLIDGKVAIPALKTTVSLKKPRIRRKKCEVEAVRKLDQGENINTSEDTKDKNIENSTKKARASKRTSLGNNCDNIPAKKKHAVDVPQGTKFYLFKSMGQW